MIKNNASNVSAGKPKVGGAIFAAPVGTPLPTSTTDELDAAFKNLGFASDSGVTNSTNLETEEIKAWGGQTVLVIQKSKDDKYKFKLLEIKNVDVCKFVYGDDNVSGDLESEIVIKCNNKDVPEQSIVIDMILSGDTAKRVVIPSCKISEVADIEYTDEDATGYETTVSCTPDSEGNTHYEYIKKASTPSG